MPNKRGCWGTLPLCKYKERLETQPTPSEGFNNYYILGSDDTMLFCGTRDLTWLVVAAGGRSIKTDRHLPTKPWGPVAVMCTYPVAEL